MSLIPPFYMNTVVAIGNKDNAEGEIQWSASGFFYAKQRERMSAEPQRLAYLVSNCHVLSNRKEIFLRMNPQGKEDAVEVLLKLDYLCLHPTQDIAVVPIDIEVLLKHKLNSACFEGEIHAATTKHMVELGVSEGDYVYVLGFPMSVVGPGDRRNAVLVRHGSIARLRDTLDGHSNSFLVDTVVFPGNSGGPVVLKPEGFAIEGTQKIPSALLIGVLCANLFSREAAVSNQTNRTRIVFEDNAGLGVVLPVDYIEECIALCEAQRAVRESQQLIGKTNGPQSN